MPAGNSINLTSSTSGLVIWDGTSVVSSTAPTNHAVMVGTGSNSITSVAAGTTGQVLQTNTGADPTFSTATYPSTSTANQLLYSSATNTIGGLATANNGTLVTSNSGVPSILAGPGTTGQVLQSNAAAAPSFSTASYPSTTTVNQVLYSSATNTVAGLSTANNGLLVTSNSGVPSILAGPGTTGQVLQANSAAAPSFSTASYPSTTTINQILYSSAANTVTGLATANTAILATNSSGVPSITTASGNWLNTSRTCFCAKQSSNTPNITGDGTTYTIIFPTSVFDQASNYNTGTGTFTAPVTGRYLFTSSVSISNIGVAHTSCIFQFSTTSNGNPEFYRSNCSVIAVSGIITAAGSIILPMTANDTCTVTATVSNSTKTVAITGSPASYFTGILLV